MQKLLQQAQIDFNTLKQTFDELCLPNKLLLQHEKKIVYAFAHSDFIKKIATQYPKGLAHILTNINEAVSPVNDQAVVLDISYYTRKHLAIHQELQNLAKTNTTAQALEIQAGAVIRQFRQLQMLLIAFFDLHKLQSIETSLLAVSQLANHIINAANEFLYELLCTRYGAPQNKQPLLIMAMGKLGGNELNFSSDIDLIFTYPEQGETQALSPGKKTIEHQVFFTRLAQKLIAMLDQVTQDGFAYRVDMRLRPLGESGPLVLPISALESYYQEQGRQWERFAMQKMRIINNSPYNETLYAIIRPFVYRKYIDFTSIESIREMKLLIEKEVRRRQINHNIKLGKGGIREVEFFIQSLQLIHAGRHVQCQQSSILMSMQVLEEAKLTGDANIQQLKTDYLYLRKVEHYLQIFNDEQTQTLPFLDKKVATQATDAAQARLCSLLWQSQSQSQAESLPRQEPNDSYADNADYADYEKLCDTINACMNAIHAVFNSIVDDPNKPQTSSNTRDNSNNADDAKIAHLTINKHAEIVTALDDIWQLSLQKSESVQALENTLNEASATVFVEHILRFQKKTQRAGVSERAQQSINKLMPLLLSEMVIIDGKFNNDVFTDQSDGVFDILNTICGRVTYIDLLLEHPEVRARLLYLCKKSVWVAQQIAQYPILLDELLHPLYLDHNELSLKDYKAQCADQLRQHMLRVDFQDAEYIMDRLREFKHTNQLRIAAADISGTLAINQVSDKLTLLAEVIMQQVIDIAWQQIVSLFGQPSSPHNDKHNNTNQLALVAYGKFGGIELSYGSDLDVVFVHNADLNLQTDNTGSRKDISNQEFYIKLVQRVCHICTTKTNSGILYDIDLRLRPSGSSGLLVSHIDTFLHYQETSAWTWEHQALVRSRVISGNLELSEHFNQVRRTILCKERVALVLKQEVIEMRDKMRTHLEKKEINQIDIKQTKGGIVDIEFMVQYWILANAFSHPEITTWSDNLRLLDALHNIEIIDSVTLHSLSTAYLTQRHATHRVQLTNRTMARGGKQISKKLLSSFVKVQTAFTTLFD